MKKNRSGLIIIPFALIVLMLMALVACSAINPDSVNESQSLIVESEKPRAQAGDIPQDDLVQLAQGNNTFALNLYQQLRSEPGNLFLSPYSISAALAMTYAGAEDQTAEEMGSTLGFLLVDESLHPAFNALDQHLAGLADAEMPDDIGDPFQLTIANALWGQKDFHFESDFLDRLAENYGAGLRLLDYITQPEESRQTINKWVSDQTKEKIQELIPQGAIDGDTRMVLSNAIYFKATWLEAFNKELTEDGIFYSLNGEKNPVQMMSQGSDTNLRYFEGVDFQAVELPYIGGQVSMLVLIPDQGKFDVFESVISSYVLDMILDDMAYTPVMLHFPSFEYEAELSLARTLSAMGMPTAFSEAADFSGMTGSKDLFISDVFHKAYVSVDEEGTEAAAATAVLMKLTSMPENPIELTVDRPFLFFIRDHQTNSILFMGRVVEIE